MTKRDLIFTIYELLKVSSDDTDLSEEFVSSLVDSTRAKLIKQTYGNKEWNIPIEVTQELCFQLENVASVNGATCFGTILRSTAVIPKGLSVKGANGALLSVRTYDKKQLHLNIVPVERLPFIGVNPYTSGMLYAAIDSDRKIYVVSGQRAHAMMKFVKVKGIYENPDEAFALQCDDAEVCESWDKEYPCELAMQDDIVAIIVNQLAARFGFPEDNTNNAEDDTTTGR